MKKLVVFLSIFISSQLSAQIQNNAGVYEVKHTSDDGTIEWKLNLNTDGTYTFYFNRDLESHKKAEKCLGKPDPRNHQAAKGTWTSKKHYIYFHAKEVDVDSTYNLNFNSYKAYRKSKHPRDKSDRVVRPFIVFSEASEFWIKGLKLNQKL